MIRMEFQGKDEIIGKLRALSSPSVRAAILDDFGMYLETEATFRFETETGPDGKPWPASFRAKTEGGVTLTDSGLLKASITHENTADRLEVGSARIYAAIHQFGGVIKPKSAEKLAFHIGGHLIFADKVTMPARPYLGFTDQDEAELGHIVAEHVSEVLQ